MRTMNIRNLWKKTFGDGSASIEETPNTVLRITVGEKHIANLYHDETDFCLIYKPAFTEVGLPPFNPEDLKDNEHPIIDHCYRSKELWFVFAERIGALDRRDFAEEMKKMGLTKDSPPLLLLGKLGTVSISKPWRLELVKKVKNS